MAEAEQESQVAANAVVPLELTGSLNTFPSRGDFDQDTLFLDPDRIVERNELFGLQKVNNQPGSTLFQRQTLALVASLLKERRASTSVETRPGMMAKISLPNSTSYRS